MKKHLGLLIYLLILCCFALQGQQYNLSGTIRNKYRENLGQTSISLRNISSEKFSMLHTVSDSLGYYHFEKLFGGRYILTASHVGYLESVSDTIDINANHISYIYHLILAKVDASLKEVTITNRKEKFEIEKGKIVFNIQNNAANSTLTAFDLLQKMPGVTIDENENLMLRGSTGINVLINGKMTYLSGSQLTNYLKGISADDISKIELNLTPSAEFDAAGNGGIINIMTKKNLQKGYAVDFRSSFTKGKYGMVDENVSASYRSRKINMFGSLDYKTPDGYWNTVGGNTINDSGMAIELKRYDLSNTGAKYYTWHVGGEWEFLHRHVLNFDYLGYLDDWKNTNISLVKNIDENGYLLSSSNSTNNLYEPYHYDAATLDYRFNIDSTGKKITSEAHYVSYRNYSDNVLTTINYGSAGDFTAINILKGHQPVFITINSIKADAELPFKKFSLRAGLKYAEAATDNQYRFDSLHNGKYEEVPDMSNHFKYDEKIAAAYISASKKIKKTSLDAGLRFEYTKTEGYTLKQDVNNKWEYGKLFPSLSIAQEISENDKIDFSASRRINRPSYSSLNPVRWYNDKYYYYIGNPDLVPEIAWILSMSYTLKQKYVFTATYGLTDNYTNRKLSIDTNGYTIKSQPANLGRLQRFDMIASLPLQFFSFWEMQLMPDISYMAYPISQLNGETMLSKWFVTLSVQQHFKLPAAIKIDISTQYYSKALRGVYVTNAGFYTDLGVKRSFYKNKLDVQLMISDIFNVKTYQAFSVSNITNYYYNSKPDTRRIGVTLHYHLGTDVVKENNKKTEEQERL